MFFVADVFINFPTRDAHCKINIEDEKHTKNKQYHQFYVVF